MNIIKRSLVAAFAVSSILISTTGVASAWGEHEYTGNGKPQFNPYTNVDLVGSEKDFFKVGAEGAKANQMSNEYNACSGNAQYTVYVHNGAPEEYNGTNNDGTGVARGTKLQIKLPTGSSKVQPAEAVISANNAPSISDGATIKCGDHDIKVDYIVDSATIFTLDRGEQKLSNAVVKDGTLIGTYADDGIVPGCWEQRIYVTIKVKITKKEVPVTPPVTPPVQPPVTPATTLPKTGAGSVLGVVAAVTLAGAVAHNLYTRRTSRQ